MININKLILRKKLILNLFFLLGMIFGYTAFSIGICSGCSVMRKSITSNTQITNALCTGCHRVTYGYY